MSRAFTTVNTQPKNTKEAESYLSDSEDEYEASNFQIDEINFGKMTSNLNSWTRNSNLASKVFSTRLMVITSE